MPDSNDYPAGEYSERLRHSLTTFFTLRRCIDAEDLADTTLNRAAQKLEAIGENYVGDPTRYFYGVARQVYREYLNRGRP